jgi:hypothetical protein
MKTMDHPVYVKTMSRTTIVDAHCEVRDGASSLLWRSGVLHVFIYLSGSMTAVAVFRKPNAIPPCFSIDIVLNFSLSWLRVLLPSMFF